MPPSCSRLLAAAVVCGALALPSSAPARPIIVNPDGSGTVPWQVFVDVTLPTPDGGFLCGGTVRDALHVITAAHCTFDDDPNGLGQVPVPPGAYKITAGATDITANEATQQVRNVVAVSTDPAFEQRADGTPVNDDAILTLDAPLDLSAPSVVGALDVLPAGATATQAEISGWGQTSDADPTSVSAVLQEAVVNVLPDAACSVYGAQYVAAVMVCGGRRNTDGTQTATCHGDSGGPIGRVTSATQTTTTVDGLLGIVSWGSPAACGDPQFPDVWTRVTNPQIRAFLTQPTPVQRPANTGAPGIAPVGAALAAGSDVRCDAGQWTGAPQLTFEFIRSPLVQGKADFGQHVTVAPPSGAATYRLGDADVGGLVGCIVRGSNPGGVTTVVVARALGPVTARPAAAPAPAPIARDVTPPNPTFSQAHCTGRVCSAILTINDPNAVAGGRVDGPHWVRLGHCAFGRRGAACRRTRTGIAKVRPLGANIFLVSTPRLRRGRYQLIAWAFDAAGNWQRKAAIVSFNVRR